MKRFLTIFGGICAAIILLVLIVGAFVFPHLFKLNREGSDYVKTTIPVVVENWDSKNLYYLSTQKLRAEMDKNPANTEKLFEKFKALGALKNLQEPVGNINSSYYSETGKTTLGDYSVKAEFEHATGVVLMEIVLINGKWQINGFRINWDTSL